MALIKKRHTVGNLALFVLTALANASCSADVSEGELAEVTGTEPVAQLEQAIWEDQCWFYSPDFDNSGSINHVSATTYDKEGCNKTWIAQVSNFNRPSLLIGVFVLDRGSIPTSRSACEDLWMAAQLAEANKGSSSFHLLTADGDTNYRKRGQWRDGECIRPSITFPGNFFDDGNTYRIFATSRTARQGSTRKMQFWTLGF